MNSRVVMVIAVLACVVGWSVPAFAQEKPASKKPQLYLSARPVLGFTPAKIAFIADLRGGDDDYEEFYCATVEWEWDDGTTSESSADCDPYQPGRSTIKRHFLAQHLYDVPDNYRVMFRLKKKDKVVGVVSTDIEVRPGR